MRLVYSKCRFPESVPAQDDGVEPCRSLAMPSAGMADLFFGDHGGPFHPARREDGGQGGEAGRHRVRLGAGSVVSR